MKRQHGVPVQNPRNSHQFDSSRCLRMRHRLRLGAQVLHAAVRVRRRLGDHPKRLRGVAPVWNRSTVPDPNWAGAPRGNGGVEWTSRRDDEGSHRGSGRRFQPRASVVMGSVREARRPRCAPLLGLEDHVLEQKEWATATELDPDFHSSVFQRSGKTSTQRHDSAKQSPGERRPCSGGRAVADSS